MDLSIFSFRAPKQNYRKPIKYFGTPFVLVDMLVRVRRVSICSDQIRIRFQCSIVDGIVQTKVRLRGSLASMPL